MHTVHCDQCHAKNTLDGAFCRQCGAPLPEDARQAARDQAQKMVGDGRQLLSDGRTHEAVMVAESVLEVDPANADALALIGDIYERDGQIAEALETYERVCELRPDSAIDRIRVSHLRKTLSAMELGVDSGAERRRSLLLVASAGVLLLSVGAAFFFASSGPNTPDSNLVAATTPAEVDGFGELNPTLVPNVPSGTRTEQTPSATVEHANQGSEPAPSGSFTSPLRPRGSMGFTRPAGGSGISPFDPGAGASLPDWKPQVNVTPHEDSRPDSQPATRPADEGTGTESEPKEDPGIIEIRKTSSSRNSGGTGAQSVDDLIRKARNLYIQEDYAGACQLYEQAIGMGAQTGATYQRLAQCYERLNRRSDAISAYRKAVAAFDAQINRGGSSASVKAAKDMCEKAIQQLGG